jgi:hypothetical protein
VADGPPSIALDEANVDATFGSGAANPELACSTG